MAGWTRWVSPVTRVGYEALHNRMGVSMPQTGRLTLAQRPAGDNDLMSAGEIRTPAGDPA
ncbi:hypothetical protein [Actinoplanes sp. SE50]|uniref:hypothetical protein n=1 Tax=Actinoplanes sp. SE50 TaxID=2033844 RepID=UPI0002DDDAF3|nr:hypothetical protein [Actinoplanes sp. SE50]